MTDTLKKVSTQSALGVSWLFASPVGPHIYADKEDGTGGGSADDTTVKDDQSGETDDKSKDKSDSSDAVLNGGKPAKADAATSKDDKADDSSGDDKDKKPDDKADDDKSAEGAPEGDYEFTMPEGMQLDKQVADAYSPVFKELNLSNDKAQKLVDTYVQAQTDAQKAQVEAWQKMQVDWVSEAKADKEIGGGNWDATVDKANAVIRTFGNDGLVEALSTFALGNHPEMIRFCARIGDAVGEDALTAPAAAAAAISVEERLYGKTTPTKRG